jgi:hypothetical protein
MADCCGKARSHLLSEISWNSRGRYSIALIAAPSAIAQQAGGAQETGGDIRLRHQRQAERVGTLLHGDPQNVVSAVREVNAEENSQTACGLVNAAYVRGKVLMTVRAKGETFQIVPTLVIGILHETGVQSVPQNVYFSVFKIDERVA